MHEEAIQVRHKAAEANQAMHEVAIQVRHEAAEAIQAMHEPFKFGMRRPFKFGMRRIQVQHTASRRSFKNCMSQRLRNTLRDIS